MRRTRDEAADSVNEFLRAYLEDVEAGRPRSLAEYQALFPGHGELIAGELERLEGEDELAEPRPASPLAEGARFGNYLLAELLGRGGQGLVYRAQDTRLNRRVALKVLTELAALSPQALERFNREAQIASRLDDPAICTVYESGTERGLPFIAMRYVEGETLALRLETARKALEPPSKSSAIALPAPGEGRGEAFGQELDLFRVARLFERLARGLHKAHEAGVVHRDIKPGNVMVGPDGEPVLLDFGLAGVQDEGLPSVTRSGDVFGTPAYMSPEQVAGGGAHVDRRTDVYSLGVMLFECLTLRHPFERSTREALYRAIREQDPPDPHSFNPRIPKDLVTMLEVCLEKDRDRRYQSALALAEDLRRFRESQPILARAPSRVYRVRKFVRRHRVLVSSALVVFASLSVATALSTIGMLRARDAEARARLSADAEKRSALRADEMRGRAEERERSMRRLAYAAQMNLAQVAFENRFFGRTIELLDAQRPAADQEDLRGFEWYLLWRLCHNGLEATCRARGKWITSIAFTPDGSSFVTLDVDGVAERRGVSGGAVESTLALGRPCGVSPDLSDDGRFLAEVESQAGRYVLRVLDTEAWHERARWDVDCPGFRRMVLSPDGRRLAWAGGDGSIGVWDVGSARELFRASIPIGNLTALAFSPDDSVLAAAGAIGEDAVDVQARLWDANDGAERGVLPPHRGSDMALCFSSDGRLLAAAGSDWIGRVYDTASCREIARLEGHKGGLETIAFSPDDRFLASTSASDGTLRVWSIASQTECAAVRATSCAALAFSPDGRSILTGGHDGVVRRWTAHIDELPIEIAAPFPFDHARYIPNFVLGFSPDGEVLGASRADGGFELLDVLSREVRARIDPGDPLTCLAFAPQGHRFALGSRDGTLSVWEGGVPALRKSWRAHDALLSSIAFSPDGHRLATCGEDQRVKVWDADSFELVSSHALHHLRVSGVAFAPDGTTVVSSSEDGTIEFWDPIRGLEVRAFDDPRGQLYALAFGNRGRTLAVLGNGWTPWLFQADDLEQRIPLRGHAGGSYGALAFAADGRTVVTGSVDHTVKLWQVATGQELLSLKHDRHVHAIALSPDDRWLATWSCDGILHLWPAATPEEVARE